MASNLSAMASNRKTVSFPAHISGRPLLGKQVEQLKSGTHRLATLWQRKAIFKDNEARNNSEMRSKFLSGLWNVIKASFFTTCPTESKATCNLQHARALQTACFTLLVGRTAVHSRTQAGILACPVGCFISFHNSRKPRTSTIIAAATCGVDKQLLTESP